MSPRRTLVSVAALCALATGCSSAPGVPFNVTATAGDTLATISWLAPAESGGATITSYKVTAQPGGATSSTPGLSTTMSGLTNGTSYVFTVQATNSAGTSPASEPSNAVTPAALPGAPTNVAATPGSGSATVTWQPAADNGSPITGYVVTSSPGGLQATTSGSETATVSGLTDGVGYTFTVHATNAVGAGPESLPSSAVMAATPVTIAGPPTAVTAVAGDSLVTVSWTAPASTGGTPITSYVVTTDPGDATVAVTDGATSTIVMGLTNGTSYAFSVHAINAVGPGPESLPSNIVVPGSVPGAPVDCTATPGNMEVTVAWQPPTSDGGSPVLGYTIVAKPGSTTIVTAGTQVTFMALTNGTPYTFTVVANNIIGSGPASSPANPVIPATVSDAPIDVVAVAGNGEASLQWTPQGDGGSAITGYTITTIPSGMVFTTTGATTAIVTGLTNGTSYVFLVHASNIVGPGPDSSASEPVLPATIPAAPINVVAVAGDEQATVSWAPDTNNGGGAITGYTITGMPGDEVASTTGATTVVVPKLTNGTTYTFTVQATNVAGTSVASGASNPVTPEGLPNAGTSTLVANPDSTFVGDTVVVTLNVRDAAGAVMVGWPVALKASFGGTLAPLTGNTDNSGQFKSILTGTALGFVTVSAVVGSLQTSVSVQVRPAPSCTTGLRFPPPAAQSVGSEPVATLQADFNGDGNPDVVTLNIGANTLSVLLGNGDGTFQAAVSQTLPAGSAAAFPAKNSPAGQAVQLPGWALTLAVADFNGDGKLDIAVPDSEQSVDVFIGNGDGTFRAGIAYETDSAPTAVVTADFNGDKIPDLASINSEGGDVVILLGVGDGSFTTPKNNFFNAGNYPVAAVAADFNGDGKIDLAVAAEGCDAIDILLGNGDGSFQKPSRFSTNGDPYALVAADFNGDKRIDLAIVTDNDTILIELGNGDGTFQLQASSPYDTGREPTWAALGDVNGDGIVDLLFVNSNDGDFGTLLGNGDGTFQVTTTTFALGDYPYAAVLADFNKDGVLDVVASNSGDNTIQMLPGKAGGTFVDIGVSDNQAFPTAIAEADLNRDGLQDLVVGDSSLGGVNILYGNGDGTFQSPLSIVTTEDYPSAVAVADFNADGFPDIAVADVDDSEVTILLATGKGGFTNAGSFETDDGPTSMAVADFNLDGLPDLVVVCAGSQDVLLYLNSAGAYAPSGQKLIVNGPPETWLVDANGPIAVATADFNGDGFPDVAYTTSAGVSVLLGNGNGTFQPAEALVAGADPSWVGVADMNGDGRPDLILTSQYARSGNGGQISVLLGSGGGTFQMPTETVTTPNTGPAAIRDFDGDGKLDLMVVGQGLQVFLFSGQGDGTFREPVPYLDGDYASNRLLSVVRSQTVAKGLDATEAMVDKSSSNNCTLSDATNNYPGCLTPGINTIIASDFNSDGRPDIAVAGWNTVGVLTNQCAP